MRNTTKLKQILLKYDLDMSMDGDNLIRITLVDKNKGVLSSFENSSYSTLISKAYSYFLKAIKEESQLQLRKAR